MNSSKRQVLAGRTALITGGAGTIGTAIAESLVADGAHVVLIDIVRPTSALARSPAASVIEIDLSELQALKECAQRLLVEFGCIDILVNNAGTLSNNKLDGTEMEEWRSVHTVNVDAAFLLSKTLVPAMRANAWGRIICISSYAAKCGGLTAGTAYSVSKSALVGLTFSIAREVADAGITANAVAPAYVLSPMVQEQLSEEQRQRKLAEIPVRRFCRPEEVAHAVSFLASPLAGFITGEVIDMNGGLQFD